MYYLCTRLQINISVLFCSVLFYGEAPPVRGTFFRLQVYKRVGISQAEVYKRVGKSVI